MSTSLSHAARLWDVLDAVVVINLDHRADRWEQVRAHLLGGLAVPLPPEKLHRLPAVRGTDVPGFGSPRWFGRTRRQGTWAGRGGCALSHRNALRLLGERGWRRALILEDDARFENPLDAEGEAALAAFLADPARAAGACFLGFNEPMPPARRLRALGAGASLYAIRGCLAAHAYIMDAPACPPLLARMPQADGDIWPWLARHTALDTWYGAAMSGLFPVTAVSPPLAQQSEFYSDITLRTGGAGVESKGHEHADPLARLRGGEAGACLARLKGAPGRWLNWQKRRWRGF